MRGCSGSRHSPRLHATIMAAGSGAFLRTHTRGGFRLCAYHRVAFAHQRVCVAGIAASYTTTEAQLMQPKKRHAQGGLPHLVHGS
jgi:hypothetical protein